MYVCILYIREGMNADGPKKKEWMNAGVEMLK